MTLQPYNPDRLDMLALRLLDLCGRVRAMARQTRDEQLTELELHDRKVLEYLEKFEVWLCRAEAEVQGAKVKIRGRRAAQAIKSGRPK